MKTTGGHKDRSYKTGISTIKLDFITKSEKVFEQNGCILAFFTRSDAMTVASTSAFWFVTRLGFKELQMTAQIA